MYYQLYLFWLYHTDDLVQLAVIGEDCLRVQPDQTRSCALMPLDATSESVSALQRPGPDCEGRRYPSRRSEVASGD